MENSLPVVQRQLWAKYDKVTGEFHPLICHLIDSGNIFLYLWNEALPPTTKQVLCQLFDRDEQETNKIIHLLVCLHDIGKASSAFQSLVPELKDGLEPLGFSFPPNGLYSPQRHDLISAWWIQGAFPKKNYATREDADKIACVLGAHHGFFYSSSDLRSRHRITNFGSKEWFDIRDQIFKILFNLIRPPDSFSLSKNLEQKQTTLILLTGIVVVSDWLASDEKLFPYFSGETISIKEYNRFSKKNAIAALQKTGWLSWNATGDTCDFSTLFGFEKITPIQEKAIEISQEIKNPFLAIVEAQTGQGKTEAALFLADHIIQTASLRGMYVAMPTMATSNQMFDRVSDFLKKRYSNQLVNIQLAHGQAQWNQSFQSLTKDSIGFDMEEQQGIFASSWFFPKKRTLLAPFGVGTVDQALLSVLKSKHFFLRLFGLAYKVIVFDEVHAYDLYMSTLFIRLLEWLRQMDCSVIVLSATLPKAMKEKMVQVYSGEQRPFSDMDYPSLTLAQPHEITVKQPTSNITQEYHLEKIGYQIPAIIEYLEEKLDTGGNAVVICNTVARAQQVYEAIEISNIILQDYEQLILFHARFPYLWREEIEKQVLELYGKNGNRPRKSILVATQVVEQSLDLDFDVMITDIAPIDLLIQRAGRIHRHKRESRPEKLKQAYLCICLPEDENDIDFGSSTYIYDEDILLKTYFLLQQHENLNLPAQTRDLIERVYDASFSSWLSPQQNEKIVQKFGKIEAQRQKEIRIANENLIPMPYDESLLHLGRLYLEEDSPEIHQAFQALTRLATPSISLICLEQSQGKLFTLDGHFLISLEEMPESTLLAGMNKSIVNISNWHVINYFRERCIKPEIWRKHAVLRNCYPAIFENGVCQLDEKWKLILNKHIGLKIMEEK